MDRLAEIVGRKYRLFDYVGAPDAERVVVLMGSGCEAAHECVEHLVRSGEKVGLLKVRLYRPFDAQRLVAAIPPTVRRLAVLDRTKEPGAAGEPLYLDCVAAFHEAGPGGRRHRRALRALLEGVHARDGQGGVRRRQRARVPSVTSRSGSRTTSVI